MDEETRAMLDSLEERSRRDRVMRNVDIVLRDKENYNLWKEQMLEMLESEEMTCFVDGSLTDPDPKGESQEELVRLYSEKWKKLDKQVMEWIWEKLDETLKEVVQESKTSKDIWYKLRTYLGIDIDVISSLNVRSYVSIKLFKKDHYRDWVLQMKKFLQANGMFGYVNGELKDPDPKGESLEEHVSIFSKEWKRADKLVMEWIMATVNDILSNMVKDMKTAKELWDTLETFFNTEELGPLDSNYLPKLKFESTYIRWKEQIESLLLNKKMGGFIDGTFRDPSEIFRTIRQKDKAIVKVYSERWTLLDQRVMTLIKSSLSVILHDIVEDLKSSKEFWHALEILFTTGYPSPSHLSDTSFVSIKLGKKNYLSWAQQIKYFLELNGLQNLIDPLSRPPPIAFGVHKEWKKFNELLKGWIISSLTQDVIDETLLRIPTATGLWGEIKNRYGPPELQYTTVNSEYNQGSYTQLYTDILSGDIKATRIVLDSHNFDAELDVDGNTPLHIIIGTRKENHQYFEQVLNLVVQHLRESKPPSTPTSPVLVDLVDRHGRNTLHAAARVGNLHAAQMLVDKDPYLLFKEDHYKCLPVHDAISTPHKDTFRYLLIASKKYLNFLQNSENTEFINPFEGTHGVRLLNDAIIAGYMEVAYQLIKYNSEIASGSYRDSTPLQSGVKNFEKYHSQSISWRIFDHDAAMEFKATESALQVTNRIVLIQVLFYVFRWVQANVDRFLFYVKKPAPGINSLNEVEVKHNQALLVLRSICNQVRLLSTNVEKHGQYKDAAIQAVYEDKHEALEEIAKHFPDAVWVKDDGYHLIELAIKNRCEKVYKFLAYETVYRSNFFKDYEKKDGNNMLHLAAKIAPPERLEQDAGAALQIRKGYLWYKHVEKFAPPGSNKEKNDDGDTPPEAMNKNYADKKKEAEEWMKTCAQSYSLIAALIMTITFAALITVPGGNSQGSEVSRVASPVGSQASPIGSPVEPPVQSPVAPPVQSPVLPPVWSPVVPRLRSPVEPRLRSPIAPRSTVAPPVWSTEVPPVQSQIGSTVAPPVKSPAVSPVASPLGSSVAPPVKSQQDSEGLPVFLKKSSFRVFAITNTLSFAFATIAVMMFVSILTSRYKLKDIAIDLPRKLTLGIIMTFLSVACLMAAFGEILHLMFGHEELLFIAIMFGCTVPAGLMFLAFQVKMIWRIYGRRF